LKRQSRTIVPQGMWPTDAVAMLLFCDVFSSNARLKAKQKNG
jgi:hypothetical protein